MGKSRSAGLVQSFPEALISNWLQTLEGSNVKSLILSVVRPTNSELQLKAVKEVRQTVIDSCYKLVN